MAITGRGEAAEDAVQDALLACLRSSVRPDNPLAYLRTAVRHAALRIKRSQASLRPSREAVAWVQVDGHQVMTAFAQQINDQLASLPMRYRECIVLHIYAGMSFREIAELQGRSTNTVASWYRRGIDQLKKRLNEDD